MQTEWETLGKKSYIRLLQCLRWCSFYLRLSLSAGVMLNSGFISSKYYLELFGADVLKDDGVASRYSDI